MEVNSKTEMSNIDRVLKISLNPGGGDLPSTIKEIKVEGKVYKPLFLKGVMVYVYKKLIGKKSYYYLRVSERKGKKVISKDLAYLGNSIKEVKKELKNLSKWPAPIYWSSCYESISQLFSLS